MRLDSVFSLQQELLAELEAIPITLTSVPRARPLRGTTRRTRIVIAYSATRRSEVDRQARTIALGVMRRSRNDYRLAVRLQRRDLLDSDHVARIRAVARNEVDVRYIGRITMRAATPEQRRQRPLRIGLSIGHHRITAGTLGAFVRVRGTGEIRMLSNNHVFADQNRGKEGEAIIQPGAADGGRAPADRVGALAKYVRLSKTAPNVIDAALATIDKGIAYRERALQGIGTLDGVLRDPSQITGTVEKIGRTTGHTTGRVSAFSVQNVIVHYDIGNLRFDGQIEIEGAGTTGFSEGGDSGSLIWTSRGHEAVGLLFAGGDVGGSNGHGLTFANPIGQVLDRLKVDL